MSALAVVVDFTTGSFESAPSAVIGTFLAHTPNSCSTSNRGWALFVASCCPEPGCVPAKGRVLGTRSSMSGASVSFGFFDARATSVV